MSAAMTTIAVAGGALVVPGRRTRPGRLSSPGRRRPGPARPAAPDHRPGRRPAGRARPAAVPCCQPDHCVPYRATSAAPAPTRPRRRYRRPSRCLGRWSASPSAKAASARWATRSPATCRNRPDGTGGWGRSPCGIC
jgi:hypothetical protein